MLLRFLQERELRPIGVRQAYRVDVRVIAATNEDLEVAIARGEFRADLYDRLREVVVEVPPSGGRISSCSSSISCRAQASATADLGQRLDLRLGGPSSGTTGQEMCGSWNRR
jgi:transcriptional regulator of acetoin/glycerol metabolism